LSYTRIYVDRRMPDAGKSGNTSEYRNRHQ